MLTKSEMLQLKKCVAFIFGPAGDEIAPLGTGFFVGLPFELKDSAPRSLDRNGSYHLYLVTARHVIQDQSKHYLGRVFARVNTINGGSAIGEVIVDEDHVLVHDEPEVDLAVIPVGINPRQFDIVGIPNDMITTKEKLDQFQIGEGEDVFFVGLFSHHLGRLRNQPIVRFGKVALMSEEKIQSGKETEEDLYLMDCHSFAANSGSPAFFYVSLERHPAFLQQRLFLAGVVKGHFRFPPDYESPIDTGERPNIGVAAIIPAYKLYEILHTPRMKKMRSDAERIVFKQIGGSDTEE